MDTRMDTMGSSTDSRTAPTVAPDSVLDYERIDSERLMKAVRLWPDEHLLVLRPFGWHLDGRHIPNAAEHFSRDGVCREHGWRVLCDFGPYIAVVTSAAVSPAVGRESVVPTPEADPRAGKHDL